MAQELRKSGIDVVGDIRWGTHYCHFYETKQDLLETLVPYFRAGLESNEFCVWVVSNAGLITVDEAKGALIEAVPDIDRHVLDEHIEILNGHDWYLEGNVLNLERATNAWDAKLEQALDRGYEGMRVSGDTIWLRENDWKDFCAYEKKINESITDRPITLLCTYSLAKSGASEILDVVRTHQFAIARRQGEWEVVEAPDLKQAKAEIKRLHDALEQRVVERTSELATTNEELRREITERRRMEQELRARGADLAEAQRALDERLCFETLLTELSAAFANLPTNEVDQEIDKWLQSLVKFLGVDRASFLQFEEDSKTLYRSHSYTVPGIEALPRPPIVLKDQFPWITDQLRRGVTVKWSRIPDDMPQEAAQEREYAAKLGVKSGLNIPVRMGGSVICAITFTSIVAYRDWPDAVVARLRLVGEIFAAAVERKRTEAALRKSEEQFRQMSENIREVFWLTTADLSKLLYISPAYDAVWAQSHESLYRELQLFYATIHVEDRSRVLAIFERDSEQGFEVEYRILRPDGSIRWIRDRRFPVNDESGRFYRLAGIAEDVTERKDAEALLHAREQEFRAIVENAPDQIIRYDREFRRIYVNPAVAKFYGMPAETLIGKPLGSNIQEAGLDAKEHQLAEVRQGIAAVFNTGKSYDCELTWATPAGHRSFSIRLFPELDLQGTVVNVLGISRDITERKQAEDALRLSEDRIRFIIDTIPTMAWSVLPDGTVDFANQRWLDYAGQRGLENPNGIVHPEDLPGVVEKWLADMAAGEPSEAEMRLRRADGEYRWFLVRTAPLRDEQGNLVKWYGVSIDIEDRKRAEEKLSQSETQLAEAQHIANVGSWNWDLQSNALHWSDELYRIFEVDPKEFDPAYDDFILEFVHPEDRAWVRGIVETSIKTKEPFSFHNRVRRRDWKERVIHARGNIVSDEDGNPIRAFGTAQDVTERKHAEEALREAEQKYRDIFENAGEGIFQSTPEGRYIAANPALAQMYRFASPEELIQSREDISRQVYVDPTRREEFKRQLDEYGALRGFEHEVFRKDGSKLWISVNARAVRDEQGAIQYYEGTAQDINERKAAEATLKATSEQLRALSARLQSAREEEGTRIAREIHDELGSVLTSLKWDLEGTDRILAGPMEPSQVAALRKRLHALTALTDSAISAIRRIASELRPSVLDDLGLAAAIEWQAQQFEARTGIVCECDCSLENAELSKEQATAVFRILQEALTNVLRHAQATRVEIKINEQNGYFTLSIGDNGIGITESAKSDEQSLGILGMRERAHLIGAKTDIKGVEGKGTVVFVRVQSHSRTEF